MKEYNKGKLFAGKVSLELQFSYTLIKPYC